MRLRGQSRDAQQSIAQNDAKARELRDRAQVIRRSIDKEKLAAVQVAAHEANALIDRRTFSWTELLNQFQATLPPDVRIAGVVPQTDAQGRRLVQISVFSKRIEDLEQFMDALEKTGAFSGVLPRSDQSDESGTLRSELQAYYTPVLLARPEALLRRLNLARRVRVTRVPATRVRESRQGGRSMKALFTFGADVPVSRVLADHRRWLIPAAIVLAINVVVLVAVVLPLRSTVQSGSSRADVSAVALREAVADLKEAEATRDGQTQASADLVRFYAEVLPADISAARRVTHVKFTKLAMSHDVMFQSGATTSEELRDSSLERLRVNYSLTGDWDDIRQLIYELETGPDFIVIDNVQLAEGAQANAPLSLTLELSTYYRVTHAP